MDHRWQFHCIYPAKVQNLPLPRCKTKIFRHFYPIRYSPAKYPCSHKTMDSWSNHVPESHRIHSNGQVSFTCHYPWVFAPSHEWLGRQSLTNVIQSILSWFFQGTQAKSHHSQMEQIPPTSHKPERRSCSSRTHKSSLCLNKLLAA